MTPILLIEAATAAAALRSPFFIQDSTNPYLRELTDYYHYLTTSF